MLLMLLMLLMAAAAVCKSVFSVRMVGLISSMHIPDDDLQGRGLFVDAGSFLDPLDLRVMYIVRKNVVVATAG